MPADYTCNFDRPSEVVEAEKLVAEIVSVGGVSLSKDIHEPGWRWSEHIKPLVGTEWCETRHVGYVLKGRLHILMRDGEEFECRPGDLMDIPAGHDGWVVGDEPLETLGWVGATSWLTPLHLMKEHILVTLLFTDIVGSTTIAQRLGDQKWSDLLGTHDQRMADAVERHGGRVVKMTGDGILAVFDGAVRAIRCAIACRAAALDAGLSIRSAVHTGEVSFSGDDIHGLAVHEASRLMGHAGGDEILVSDMTRGLARDPNITFDDRGQLELRGLEEPFRAYAVIGQFTT